MGAEELAVVADRGYFSGDQIKVCADAQIVPVLPKPQTSSNRKKNMFVKSDFRYVTEEAGLVVCRYWTTACGSCPLKSRCTTSKERRISRWEHEPLVEAMQQRLDEHPDAMRLRRETVEHPFGTLKMWMGATHFLRRRLQNVKTELALSVLADNLIRVMNIIDIKPLMAAIRA